MPAQAPSTLETFIPFIFVFVLFYFLAIRPQSKRQKEHQKFLSEIKRGDEVITSSGILGTVEGLNDQVVTLEISPGVRIKVLKSNMAAGKSSLQQTALQEKK
ncbi:MAG TPA: preprotein translocase subunit YajC [Pseudobdellovibrionaceae bacterium]|nr:preprotein translocase subunit YajC [Pseudobdellovibrionaceae bacterium]